MQIIKRCKICNKPVNWCISDGEGITYHQYIKWINNKEDMCIFCYCENKTLNMII